MNLEQQALNITNEFIVFTQKEKCGDKIVYVVDSKTNGLNHPSRNTQFTDVRIEDEKVVATGSLECECTEDNKPLCEKRTLTFKIDDKGLNVS